MTNDKTKYIDAVGRVVKIKFNVLKNRIEEIEIGERKKKSVLDVITSTVTNTVAINQNAATLGKVFKRIVYDDVTLVSDTPEAFNVVYAQLRERVQKDFDNGLDKLKINNTIKYIQLLNTEEYKPYAKLFTEKC